MINGVADLNNVTYVQRSPDFIATMNKEMFATMAQSALIHPDWTADDMITYLVNDEFIDPVDIVSVLGNVTNKAWSFTTWFQTAKRFANDHRDELTR